MTITKIKFPPPAARRVRHYSAYFQVSPADIIKTAVAQARSDQYPVAIPKLTSGFQLQNVLIHMPIFSEPSPPGSPRFGKTYSVPRRVLETECKKLATMNPTRLQTWLLAGIGMFIFHKKDSLSYSSAGISQWAQVVHALLQPPAGEIDEPATLSRLEYDGSPLIFGDVEQSGINQSLPYGWIPVTPDGPFDEPVQESVEISDGTTEIISSRYASIDEWVIDQTLHSLEARHYPIFPGECIASQTNTYAMKIPRVVMPWIGIVAERRELHRAQVLREFLYAGAGLFIATPDIAKTFAAEVRGAVE